MEKQRWRQDLIHEPLGALSPGHLMGQGVKHILEGPKAGIGKILSIHPMIRTCLAYI